MGNKNVNQERVERAKEACGEVVEELFRAVNGGSEDLQIALIDHLQREHPTLQQLFFKVIHKAICDHADRTYTDLRNEASVAWAKKVKEIEEYFPLI